MAHSPANTITTTAGRRPSAVAAVARSHISPLALVELTAFGAALLAGWGLIASAILGFHLLRMGVVAFGAWRKRRDA